jgi:hypothetical protein
LLGGEAKVVAEVAFQLPQAKTQPLGQFTRVVVALRGQLSIQLPPPGGREVPQGAHGGSCVGKFRAKEETSLDFHAEAGNNTPIRADLPSGGLEGLAKFPMPFGTKPAITYPTGV